MATDLPSCYHAEEDYIDMEVSSSSNFFFGSTNSPPQTREFEFQMSLNSHEKETTTSPADELFYKGKLLPLHLPPRLQMVQKLLQNSNTTTFDNTKDTLGDDHFFSIPFLTSSTTSSTNTPLESCNISPSESCRVSSELNPDEYFFEWSTELTDFIGDHPKKFISWSKKLKLIKQSSLRQKLKASKAYLKSLFNKSACSDESCAKEGCNVEAGYVSKGKENLNKYKKVAKKNPFGQTGKGTYPTLATVINSIEKEAVEDGVNGHRKSFSGAIKRHSATKSSSSSSSGASSSSSSSSFSFNSNGFNESQFLKRSSSANSEIESSIEGAIAHCKQSQQIFTSRKPISEMGLCSLSASRITVSGDKERPGFCSI